MPEVFRDAHREGGVGTSTTFLLDAVDRGSPATIDPDGDAISVRGLSRLFGWVPALASIDLEVPRGSVMLVWGPNGAGKSTLVRILATLLRPTYGEGRILGFDLLTDRPQIRRRVELLGHRTRLYDDLTPREHLAFVASLHRSSASIAEAVELAGIGTVADRRIATFSQGMRQRVAVARAHLRRPELLLLDEPYAALDDDARRSVDGLLVAARGDGRTVVVATHDVERLSGLADVGVRLDRGRVMAYALPARSG
ncbi:MAG TPA: ABC transporter ATP-binding protein [Actinomycetota bacterium]|nr:ABC transporter ATP-binding protein [Actinomycetota bacterium]